jgi:hypothetical protein
VLLTEVCRINGGSGLVGDHLVGMRSRTPVDGGCTAQRWKVTMPAAETARRLLAKQPRRDVACLSKRLPRPSEMRQRREEAAQLPQLERSEPALILIREFQQQAERISSL